MGTVPGFKFRARFYDRSEDLNLTLNPELDSMPDPRFWVP